MISNSSGCFHCFLSRKCRLGNRNIISFLYGTVENSMILLYLTRKRRCAVKASVYCPATEKIPLHERVTALEQLLGVWLTVHDIRGIWSARQRDALLPGRRWHRCPFCEEGRFTDKNAEINCSRDCMTEPHLRVRSDPRPFLKCCWRGAAFERG